MKRNFVLMSVVLCSVCISQAQIKKGAVLLGGNLGFATQSNTAANQNYWLTRQTTLSMSPAFGKTIRENLVIGADIIYDYSKSTYSGGPDRQKNTAVGAGIFVRKYKYLGSNFYLFGQGRLGATSTLQESVYQPGQTILTNKTKGYSVTAGFYPGISYAVTNKLHLETGFNNLVYVNYSHNKITNEYNPAEYKSNSFSLGSSLSNFSSFTVGVRFLLNKQS